ncbi:nucleotidyltransferase domain-containing protein [Rhodospirillum rubrum]|uniref:Nucleotidyltransferase family protein n=1 Tax=Rhodospirillum rubrum (strain ATCC 11170 / ATH 1.1.1 / DSM 467 / LMG 4362 / NCIMB 8255 / S1) TaxID=269796 RepID=Q2RPP9_RHORT|nr:nucleotidyltransferase family protein [Rhodospirillum rubrum]ABC23896.1 conserved hypothetical protein [Rhodospirillum rubrum ATCC 11170]AEO49640.1 hypothetical protein F11_15890 [Rhodospirillum rubrum F11]MBK5955572.1 hypothetical protein [Rhodospirillum rubrum]QXG79841.1 nucleotidyltransferase family protein [Rhodospirillum rubrum]
MTAMPPLLSPLPTTPSRLLPALLDDPRRAGELDGATWDRLIPLARHAGVLGRLGYLIDAAGLTPALPAAPARHLRSALLLAQRHQREVHFEITELAAALRPLGVPLVLLKGAAYVQAALPAGWGRTFQDIDFCVPRARLAEVENALIIAGWHPTEKNAYDRGYYRRWMHEIPPLRHAVRGTVIDVHHALTPLTARRPVDAAALMARARPTAIDGVRHPTLADLVVHSAVHLFDGGEFDRALRDLSDIALLLGEGRRGDRGWLETLAEVARASGVEKPVAHALFHAARLFPLTVGPLDTRAASPQKRPILDGILTQTFWPNLPADQPIGARLGNAFLYIRGHALRMPPLLLAYHFATKISFRINISLSKNRLRENLPKANKDV